MFRFNKFNMKAWAGSLSAGLATIIVGLLTDGFGLAPKKIVWVTPAVIGMVGYVATWITKYEPPDNPDAEAANYAALVERVAAKIKDEEPRRA